MSAARGGRGRRRGGALDAAELDEVLGVPLLSLPQALRVSAPAASRANRALVRVICTPFLQVKVTSRTKLTP